MFVASMVAVCDRYFPQSRYSPVARPVIYNYLITICHYEPFD